ncbi:MAG: archease [Candidatus Latescibacterota bacterium]|nr:MAG: archease [Candidatus Latescibacterota bacterium]
MTELPFEEIEHTADWAIRVRGRDLPELFARAAHGMFSLLADLSEVTTTRELDLDLRALDYETLLVDWLNELLYQSEEKHVLFTSFEIHEITHQDAARLHATVTGGAVAELKKTIKAATFSSLAIEQGPDGHSVEIVFDV